VYPGPGTLLAKGPTRDYFMHSLDTKELRLGKPGGAPLYTEAAAPLDLKAGADGKEVVLKLTRGVTVKGRVLDPDGKLVESAVIYHSLSLQDNGDWAYYHHYSPVAVSVKDGAFTLTGIDPKSKVPVCIFDRKHEVGARVVLSGKSADEEVTIKLQPCGKVTTRIVDPEGKPLMGRT
jgi:hypothetical protein